MEQTCLSAITITTATFVLSFKEEHSLFSQLLNGVERACLSVVTMLSQRESLKSDFSTAESPFSLQIGLTYFPVYKVNVRTYL